MIKITNLKCLVSLLQGEIPTGRGVLLVIFYYFTLLPIGIFPKREKINSLIYTHYEFRYKNSKQRVDRTTSTQN